MSSYDATAYRRYFEDEVTYINGFIRNTHRFADEPALHSLDGRCALV